MKLDNKRWVIFSPYAPGGKSEEEMSGFCNGMSVCFGNFDSSLVARDLNARVVDVAILSV